MIGRYRVGVEGKQVHQEVIQPVILSGGAGTRLWPFSNSKRPKQFLNLAGDRSMLQMTVERVPTQEGFAPPIIVANASHAKLVQEQLEEAGIEPAMVLLEPAARNTAPAIGLAALAANPNAVLLIMPSDHVVADVAGFRQAVRLALPYCKDGWLVTFGMTPERAETGYGYIEREEPLGEGVFRVARFVEKPDLQTAEAFVARGSFSWNGGIFLFQARAYIEALEKHAPAVAEAARKALAEARREGEFVHPDAAAFEMSPRISVDYAVMEKADRVAVVPVDIGWSDIGSWDALYLFGEKDEAGNVVQGPAVITESRSCLVRSSGTKVVLSGVEDLIVLATDETVVVLRRGESQRIKNLVEKLQGD